MFQDIDTETLQLVNRALDKLRKAGVEVVTLQVSGFLDLADQFGFSIALFEATQDISAYLSSYHTGLTITQLRSANRESRRQGVFDAFIVPGAPHAIPQAAYDNAMNVVRPQLQKLYADTFSRTAPMRSFSRRRRCRRHRSARTRRSILTASRFRLSDVHPQHRSRLDRRRAGDFAAGGVDAGRIAGGHRDRRPRGKRPPSSRRCANA